MIPSPLNFDETIKANVEQLFPVELIVDRENARGLIRFTSAFPPLEGTTLHMKQMFFDSQTNDMNISYDMVENPKGLHPQDSNVQVLAFKIVSLIFELENKLLLNQKSQ